MPASTSTPKLTATEIVQKAIDEKMARDNRIAHQKKLAEQAREKNAGSTVVQTNNNPRGRRPARPQRRAPLPQVPEPVKKYDPIAARERAAAELKKRQHAKELAEREAVLKAKIEDIKQQMLASQTAATQAASTTQSASASAQAAPTSDDDEAPEAADTDGDSDVEMPDAASVSDWQKSNENDATEGSDSAASP
jgi:hypothetical protein